MVEATLRLILPLYSYLGILSIKSDKNSGFKTSKFHLVHNALKMPLVLIFSFFLLKNPQYFHGLHRNVFYHSEDYSIFLKLVTITTTQIVLVNSLYICIAQFVKRNEITKFMNHANKIVLNEECSKELKSVWKKEFAILAILFCFICIVQFTVRFKFTFFAVVAFTILLYSYVIATAFLSFMKTFEVFFFICLKDFKCRLRCDIIKTDFNANTIQDLMTRYQEIYDLNQEFNDIFGSQVTAMTCCFAIKSTSQVV